MPYFHVRIAKKTGTKWALAFNLSEEQVRKEIIESISNLQPFMCGDALITASDIDYFRINETSISASEILQKSKYKRLFYKLGSGIPDWQGLTDEWYITRQGKDVTKAFVNDLKISSKIMHLIKSEHIFIVHGREEKPALELARIIENEFGLKAILLKEEPHGGRTIIEKLEDTSDVGYAFVVITPDDIGALKGENLEERGRQNVVLEWGHFVAKLGREKTCVLLKGNIAIPSDMRGIGYHRFHESVEEVFLKIKRELKKAEII